MAIARENKFRAWDKEDNRMITDRQEFIPLRVTNIGVLRLDPSSREDKWILVNPERFEIMEYTGQKDKNGVRIYEDDVVIDSKDRYAVVYWNIEDCQFLVDFQADMEIEQINSNYIVCGNIWENFDLIK